MEFKQDEHETAVIFRKDKDEIIAVFPTIPYDVNGRDIVCFAHMGQHGSCDFDWYRSTKPAKPHEYESLKRELESAPYGYKLKVYRRYTAQLRKLFNREVERIRSL